VQFAQNIPKAPGGIKSKVALFYGVERRKNFSVSPSLLTNAPSTSGTDGHVLSWFAVIFAVQCPR